MSGSTMTRAALVLTTTPSKIRTWPGMVKGRPNGLPSGTARSARLPAGQSLAASDAGGELAEESALAEAGIAIEDGDLAGGEAAGREPLHRLGVDLTQADDVAESVTP